MFILTGSYCPNLYGCELRDYLTNVYVEHVWRSGLKRVWGLLDKIVSYLRNTPIHGSGTIVEPIHG